MRKSYLLIFDNEVGTSEELREYLNSLPQILNWRTDTIPNSIYIVSELSADEIASFVKTINKNDGAFLVTEITPNKQGWMIKDTWTMINKKTLPGEPKE
jgi:hypothetical protein